MVEAFGKALLVTWEWIQANPVGLVGGLLFAGAGVYIKQFIQVIAQTHAHGLTQISKKEVFTEPSGSLLPVELSHNIIEKSSEELIAFYVNEPGFHTFVGDTKWSFAATPTIIPKNSGEISEQQLAFRYHETWFKLDAALEDLTKKKLENIVKFAPDNGFFNGDPFCILDVKENTGKTIFEVGRCKYFDSLRTNFAMDMVLEGRGKTLRELVHGKSRAFEPFGQSRLPNHMGLVIIVETSDGQLVIQKRSGRVSVRPNTLSASVSGTFEKNDLLGESDIVPLGDALRGPLREMHGELGGEYISEPKDFYFLGLMREFRRGGFPDFYFFYRAPLSLAEIQDNAAHAEERYEIEELIGEPFYSRAFLADPKEERAMFDKRVNNMLTRIEGRANLTLSLGIALCYGHTIRQAEASGPA